MALERGTLLNKRYRVVEILGQGGMGAVYRAIDENLGMDVALKENLFTTDEYARQFRREAVILATLRHPNLTRVTDHFVVEGQGQYLVMDYIEGEDLRQRMDRLGAIDEDEAIIIGIALCDALNYLESCNPPIVHRDIKPGNVKITPQGQIFLVDFGLAKINQSGQATTTGARAMTPGYSPPEQYGTARTDHRSDLFSLGATLYAALTGSIPEDALARAMDQSDLTPIRKHNPRVSRRLAGILEKSLAVRPDDRYQTAEEFKQALLGVSNFRRKTGEYKVAPPPSTLPMDSPALQPEESGEAIETGRYQRPRNSSPLPVQTSMQLRDRSGNGNSGGRRRGWLFLTAVITFGVISVLVGLYYPSLPAQALAFIFPTPTSMAVVVGNETSVINPIAPTATNTLSPVPTATPELPNSPTATLQPAPSATPTLLIATPTQTASPTPFGGGQGEVAFASDRSGTPQIYIVKVDGTDLRQLTEIPEGACQPAWSPDGLRLVIISPCERNQPIYRGSGLFIINADGTGLTPLPIIPGGDFDPAWSPNGRYIAFASLRNSGRARIYLIDLETNEVKRISAQYSYDRQPAWSKDGKQIAFVTTQKGPVQIWTMNADGSDQKIFSRSADAINTAPSWSPDGNLILFTQVQGQNGVPGLVVASYDPEYSEFRYDLGPFPMREARYSPDGLWLVFEGWPAGDNHDIYVVSGSGAVRTRLTDDPFNDFDPAWRPMAE
jgi:serine/threonine protein kinase